MKSKIHRLLGLLVAGLLFAPLAASAASADAIIAAVTAADNERLAATKAADKSRLDAIFSDALYYAHSNGKTDTKSSYVASLVARNTIYQDFDYKTRTFTPIAPGIVQMTGRVLVKVGNKEGAVGENDLNFLAVWREENGKWRFLSWQSSRNPAPTPPAQPAPTAPATQPAPAAKK
jgi:hypothetical protein